MASQPPEAQAAVVLTRDELEALIFKAGRAPVCVFGEPARLEAPAVTAVAKLERALDELPADGARVLPFPVARGLLDARFREFLGVEAPPQPTQASGATSTG